MADDHRQERSRRSHCALFSRSQNRPVLKRYLEQFVRHVNPHTGMSYAADPNIIAIEIVNEPSHGADTVGLPDLGIRFHIRGLNPGNLHRAQAAGGSFSILPGAYLLVRDGVSDAGWTLESRIGNVLLGEFAAPPPTLAGPIVRHSPYLAVDAGTPVPISAIVSGIAPSR